MVDQELVDIGVRGCPEWDISSLRALGPGGGQISRVVHVSARAPFGVFAENLCVFVCMKRLLFCSKVAFSYMRTILCCRQVALFYV